MFILAFDEWHRVTRLATVGFFIMYKGEETYIFEEDAEAYCQE